jgi:hypothetical protein
MSETQTAVSTIPFPSIPGIDISPSTDILSADSRLAALLWAPSGYGKTYLGGQLDELTLKYLGKHTLYIALEAGEGGGLATIRKKNVPITCPKDWGEFYKILGLLRNNREIGGIVVDTVTELGHNHSKKSALTYPARENIATRAVGIPTRSDYQTMGELVSQALHALLAMTTVKDPALRKHLLVLAADTQREEDDKLVYVGADLPGRMRDAASQMFQQVLSISVKPEVVGGKRQLVRYLLSQGDGVRRIKDRLNVLPAEVRLAGPGVEGGETLTSIWEKYYMPEFK